MRAVLLQLCATAQANLESHPESDFPASDRPLLSKLKGVLATFSTIIKTLDSDHELETYSIKSISQQLVAVIGFHILDFDDSKEPPSEASITLATQLIDPINKINQHLGTYQSRYDVQHDNRIDNYLEHIYDDAIWILSRKLNLWLQKQFATTQQINPTLKELSSILVLADSLTDQKKQATALNWFIIEAQIDLKAIIPPELVRLAKNIATMLDVKPIRLRQGKNPLSRRARAQARSVVAWSNAPSTATHQPIRHLGEGAFGQAILAKQEGVAEAHVAIKQVSPRRDAHQLGRAELFAEHVRLHHCRHPFIVGTLGFKQSEKFGLIVEYMPGGDLLDAVLARRDNNRGFTPNQVHSIALPIFSALQYLHDVLNMTHSDVKAANILLVMRYGKILGAKLSDFGLARTTQEYRQIVCAGFAPGTVDHLPLDILPFLIGQVGNSNCNGSGADIWAMGIALFQILTLQDPYAGFETSPEKQMIEKRISDFAGTITEAQQDHLIRKAFARYIIRKGGPKIPIGITPEARAFFVGVWAQADKRLTAKGAVATLKKNGPSMFNPSKQTRGEAPKAGQAHKTPSA